MAKFNTKGNRRTVKPTSAVKTASTVPDAVTNEGAVGWSREPKSELFLLGVANMVAEDTFYEGKLVRDPRFEQLVTQVATSDSAWLEGFFPWLRFEANMRSAPVIGAAIAAKSMLGVKAPGGRQVIAKSLGRADEPGEFLSYWIGRWGDQLPMPVKRGLADVVVRLYTQRSLLKYDTPGKGLRFANVIQLVHPDPATAEQEQLFKFALERAYKDTVELPQALKVARAENTFRKEIADPAFNWEHFFSPFRSDIKASDQIKAAGLTWEDFLPRVPERYRTAAWEALIPTMGYMALLRNLRNFDEAGISAAARKLVADRIADPAQVAKSKQFPFRFLSAYRSLRSLHYGPALEAALDASLGNVPQLSGRTLMLVDRSSSMMGRMSDKSEVTMMDQAAIFGTAVALRNVGNVDLVEFGDRAIRHEVRRGDSLLKFATTRFTRQGGTHLASAIQGHFRGQDRVIVATDEQYSSGNASALVPPQVPWYTFNLVGYKVGGAPSGGANRHTFGGLTDAAFKVIPLLEAGMSQRWPWEAE